ncbi:helix-turn-helix transcriptional regulator [Spirosoma arcticum]
MTLDLVTTEEHQQALTRIDQLERELNIIKTLLMGERLLSRQQAMRALGVSGATLWRLTKAGTFETTNIGSTKKYCADSVRDYLVSRRVESRDIEMRLIAAYRL